MRCVGMAFVCALISSAASSSAAQSISNPDVSYSQYKSQSGKDKAVTTLYIHGIFEGFLWANGQLSFNHEQNLYCQPAKLSLTSDQEISMMDEYVVAHPNDKDLPVGLVAVSAAIYTFPCPNTREQESGR